MITDKDVAIIESNIEKSVDMLIASKRLPPEQRQKKIDEYKQHQAYTSMVKASKINVARASS